MFNSDSYEKKTWTYFKLLAYLFFLDGQFYVKVSLLHTGFERREAAPWLDEGVVHC